MVNPVLTVLFDLFLVGSACALIGALAAEQWAASREPAIGRHKPAARLAKSAEARRVRTLTVKRTVPRHHVRVRAA